MKSPIRLAKVCCSQCLPRFIFLGQFMLEQVENLLECIYSLFLQYLPIFSLFAFIFVKAKQVYLVHLGNLLCNMYRMVTI